MSLLQPLPPGTTHTLNENGMKFLPLFVRVRLQYLADIFDWYPDEGKSEKLFTYYEVRGKLSHGYYSPPPGAFITPINIWIGSDDHCHRDVYLGGSSCWICPSNHTLFFDAIDPELLPEKPDQGVWWCIHHGGGIKVIKILVCPFEEITEDFPDGV